MMPTWDEEQIDRRCEMAMGITPPGSEYYHNGLYYRKGIHGYFFRWSDTLMDWVKSTKRHYDLRQYKIKNG